MVWLMSYRPKPDSYPSADVLEGNAGELELEDRTPDGGAGLAGGGQSFSGRRVKPESVPKAIRWNGKRRFLDYETATRKTVTDRFRALIEEIEPGVHQFEPVRFVGKDGSQLGTRWFLQVCNRIDSVHRGLTNWTLTKSSWLAPLLDEPRLIFDLEKIGLANFWHDKHISGAFFVSDIAKSRIEEAGLSGVHFKHYDQA